MENWRLLKSQFTNLPKNTILNREWFWKIYPAGPISRKKKQKQVKKPEPEQYYYKPQNKIKIQLISKTKVGFTQNTS